MKILVTAGPTREPIDPVRYLGNRSSGRMGYAIAHAFVHAGHHVLLVSGPTRIDEAGCVWVSGFVADWGELERLGISVIVDLEGDIDHGVPRKADNILYVYLPIHDAHLPNLARLHAVAALVAECAARGQRVLCHCGAGLNRSPLVAGLALIARGHAPEEVVALIRDRRPGSLYNEEFVRHLLGGGGGE
jgi:NAD(P)-dependent dehydrogenase (short-subunit alcohol dehydrogenase family)